MTTKSSTEKKHIEIQNVFLGNLAAHQGFSVHTVFMILQLFYSAHISPYIFHMTVATEITLQPLKFFNDELTRNMKLITKSTNEY